MTSVEAHAAAEDEDGKKNGVGATVVMAVAADVVLETEVERENELKEPPPPPPPIPGNKHEVDADSGTVSSLPSFDILAGEKMLSSSGSSSATKTSPISASFIVHLRLQDENSFLTLCI